MIKKLFKKKSKALPREIFAVSLSWTIASLIAYAAFMFIVAAKGSAFLAEIPGRMGSGAYAMNDTMALLVTGSFAIAMILLTFIVGYYARRFNKPAAIVTAVLQAIFGFGFLAAIFGNIIGYLFGLTFLTVVTILIVFVGLGFSLYHLQRASKRK